MTAWQTADLAASYAARTIHVGGEQYRDPTDRERRAIDTAHTTGHCPYCGIPDPCPCMSVPATTGRRRAA